MRKGKFSQIRFKNNRRKKIKGKSDLLPFTDASKIIEAEEAKNRKPKIRRKIDGKWVLIDISGK